MKVIGINASPRKRANTQTLVEAILNGAEEVGAETRLVNLRELKINGCLKQYRQIIFLHAFAQMVFAPFTPQASIYF